MSAVVGEVTDCSRCLLWLTVGLAGILSGLATHAADLRMGVELQNAAVKAAMQRGEIDQPPGGFT